MNHVCFSDDIFTYIVLNDLQLVDLGLRSRIKFVIFSF